MSTTIFCNKAELEGELTPIIETHFHVSQTIASYMLNNLREHFNRFRDDISFIIEHPYVDRVYRDSYYSYYSTKMTIYPRDCIRLSLFENVPDPDLFRENLDREVLQNKYLGFIILRPTVPNIVGRSVVSPIALKAHSFLCVSSSFPVTAASVKLIANGFPHSSQDGETISCAETSIWSIMEYFSSKYFEYKPALPSLIIETLRERFTQRQLPSGGLNIYDMAFALKKFGFGNKIYAKDQFGSVVFKRLLSCYLESGIPILAALDNKGAGGNIGHAILIVGRSYVTDDQINNLPVTVEENQTIKRLLIQNNISLFDNDDVDKEYVIIDDNFPPYQLSHISTPAHYYNDPEWLKCELTYFVAPLYPKVYLDAFQAKLHIKMLFLRIGFSLPIGSDIFIRIFLASSRSYKDYLTKQANLQANIRDFILDTSMPKFIWVGEFSNKELMKQEMANGLVILGATEPDLANFKALVFAGYADTDTKELVEILFPLNECSIYSNKLKQKTWLLNLIESRMSLIV